MRKVYILILLAAFLTACLPSPPPLTPYNWTYNDLLTLDASDSTRQDLDLIALYQRGDSRELQFRLDFLELEPLPAFDLYLALDLVPGGTTALPLDARTTLEWDALVTIPARGQPAVRDPDLQPRPDLIPRVVRDPALDYMVISLVQAALKAEPRTMQVEVVLTAAGETNLADQIPPVSPATPRPARAPVLLAFWNTFPAYSPAQTLRRWDGAHTGPFGERHGLKSLLNAAAATKIPVTLLDTKNPLALSALDYLGGLELVRSLSREGLLTLPETIPLPHQAAAGDLPFLPPGSALLQAEARSRQASTAMDLPASMWLYAPLVPPELPGIYRGLFVPMADESPPALAPVISPARQAARVVIPLPFRVAPLQATPAGLSQAVINELLKQALSRDPQGSLEDGPFVFLGGDLPSSAWGDPQASRAALQYLASHPWIHALGGAELLSVRTQTTATLPAPPSLPEVVPNSIDGTPIPSGRTVAQIQREILAALDGLPPGQARDLAWTAYFALLTPNPPATEGLAALRAGYLGQVGAILTAARWAADPQPAAGCTADPDFDGQPECILANERIFTIFEPEGARLTFGFASTPRGLAQWAAPLSQFLVGWSDPSAWDLSRGPAGDPADIPGAFTDTQARWVRYTATAFPGGLRFTSPAARVTRTYTLTSSGIQALVQPQESGQYTLQIPLAVEPEARFTPGWGERYQLAVLPDGFSWQLDEGLQVWISTTGSISLAAFADSLRDLGGPEEPNFDYPPGHYVAFPVATGEITAEGTLEIEIQVREP